MKNIFQNKPTDLQREKKVKSLQGSFKRAANDPEMLQMAEEGLEDYLEQLHELEV